MLQDDKRLAKRIYLGERRAFEEFVDTYGGRVHRLVRRYVNHATDAEDVTQEIFCELHRSMGSYRGEAALSTWVYRVTVNNCLKYRQRRHPASISYNEHEIVIPSEDWRADPAASAEKRELSEQVEDALHQLTPPHYDVVMLCEMQGLTYQECATVLDIPVGTVKSRLFNAVRKLRVLLTGYVFEAGGFCPEPVGKKEI